VADHSTYDEFFSHSFIVDFKLAESLPTLDNASEVACRYKNLSQMGWSRTNATLRGFAFGEL
jgi:hypothetical protein